jgi:hypothetical protein
MQQAFSSEAKSCSAIQGILCMLRNPYFHCHIQKSPPLIPILNQIKTLIQCHSIYLRYILVLLCHLHRGLTSGLFPSCFPTKTVNAFFSPPSCDRCLPSHLPWFEDPINISSHLGLKWLPQETLSNTLGPSVSIKVRNIFQFLPACNFD